MCRPRESGLTTHKRPKPCHILLIPQTKQPSPPPPPEHELVACKPLPWGLHGVTRDDQDNQHRLSSWKMAASTFSAAARTNALANELRGGAAAGRPCSPSCRKAPSSVVIPGRRLVIFSCDRRDAYGSLAARLLGPPTRFEASKLKVVFMREGIELQSLCTTPRVYTLTHCDFTANLTLEVSNSINSDALREWQTTLQRDDVVAEWKMLNGEMTLHVHCFVSGANLLQDLAASFRYHIFSKELPLVLKAVLYGDGAFFHKHPELLEAKVLVYFHSKSKKYNCVECWGPLMDAAQRKFDDRIFGDREGSIQNSLRDKIEKLSSPKTILHALVSFLL